MIVGMRFRLKESGLGVSRDVGVRVDGLLIYFVPISTYLKPHT